MFETGRINTSMSTNTKSTAQAARLYRVKSYYKSDAPTVYYVVASGSTVAELEVLAHEDCADEKSGYFCTEQVAEERWLDGRLPMPHVLLFQRSVKRPMWDEEPVMTLEEKKKLLATLLATLKDDSGKSETALDAAIETALDAAVEAKPAPEWPRTADEILEHIKWGAQKPTP